MHGADEVHSAIGGWYSRFVRRSAGVEPGYRLIGILQVVGHLVVTCLLVG